MKQLIVHYCGWGENWPLGRLADDGHTLLFEYTPEALIQNLELSPLSQAACTSLRWLSCPPASLAGPDRRQSA